MKAEALAGEASLRSAAGVNPVRLARIHGDGDRHVTRNSLADRETWRPWIIASAIF